MKNKSILTSLVLIVGLGFYTVLNSAYSLGFSSYSTTSCPTCHSASAPVSSIAINGLPTFYDLGQAYPISVTITNTSKLIAGFQIRSNIGTITKTDPTITVYNDNRSAGHNAPKGMIAGTATFNVVWTAPTSGNTAANFGAQGIGADGTGNTNFDSGVFTTVSNIALPVKFATLKATIEQDGIALLFITSKEENVQSLEVERSTDGIHYNFLKAHTPKGTGIYNTFDNEVKSGTTYYYRIKETSTDNVISYSDVISVRFAKKELLDIYPTLVNNNVIFISGLEDLDYRFTLTSLLGSTIKSIDKVTNSVPLHDIQPGFYLASLSNKQGLIKTVKIYIQ